MRIFGREPAVWAALIQAALALLGQQVFHWDVAQVALAYGVSVGVLDTYVAWRAHQTMLGVVVGLFKAGIACYVGFGGHFSPEASAQLLALVTSVVGFVQRSATTPIPAGSAGNFDLAA